jgi:Holliday junction resolvase RusA-like endonuclease
MKLSFFVPGMPAPAGSKRAMVNRHTGRAAVIDDCKRSGPWKERVAMFAREAFDGDPLTGPLEVEFAFTVARPKGHHGSGRNAMSLKRSAPRHPIGRPDTTKLIRAAEDALKGIVWGDDSQIVRQTGTKEYGTRPGVRVTIWEVE